MPPPGASRATAVPLHISRAGNPTIQPATTVYAVSVGDSVGTSLVGAPKGVNALTTLLEKIGVGRSEIETACQALAGQAYYRIPNVKLTTTVLRRLAGRPSPRRGEEGESMD
jgi:hypothetical protein